MTGHRFRLWPAVCLFIAACSPTAPPSIDPSPDQPSASTASPDAAHPPDDSLLPPGLDIPEVEVPPVPAALQAVEEFEERALPAGYEAEGGGRVEISTLRSKSGVRSVRWIWNGAGDALWIRQPERLAHWATLSAGDRGRATLAFWCHREQPGGFLTVEFHSARGVVSRGGFPTGFRGWRALGVAWSRIKPGADPVTAIRILPPAGESSGSLHIDRMGFFLAEQPEGNDPLAWSAVPPAEKAAIRVEPDDYATVNPALPARRNPVTSGLLAEAAKLSLRIAGAPQAPTSKGALSAKRWEELEKLVGKYRLREQEGVIAGASVQGLGFHQPPGSIHISTVFTDLGQLGRAYRETADANERAQLKIWIRSIAALTLENGWTTGNRNLGTFMSGYGERGWPAGFFQCREAIGDTPEWAGLMRLVIWWFGGSNLAAQTPWGDTDIHLNGSPNVLQAIARMPPGAEQVQLFELFKRYLDKTYQQDTLIAADGTVHHHGMFHLAYACYSVPAMVSMVQSLEGTSFAVDDAVIDRLKRYVRTVAWSTHLHEMPANGNGRAGDPISTDISGMAYTLARIRGPLDREMAAIFLAKHTRSDHPGVKAFKSERIEPTPFDGHQTLNFAAGALHRREGWLASIYGMNNFTRGLEIYGWLDSNNYGRYARNGSVMIQSSGNPVGARASGFRKEGWNWSYWPGATSLVRPSHELYDYYGLYGMSGSALAGGTSLGPNGCWALDFKGRDLSFRKTVLCADNRVTIVTTDVSSRSGRPAVTTLFQHSIEETNTPTGVNGRGALKTAQLEVPAGAGWLYDTQRNGYVLPASHPRTQVYRGSQSWTYMFDRYLKDPADNPLAKRGTSYQFRHNTRQENEVYYKTLSGDFERAWIDHGTDPTNGACWYTVLVQTTPAATETFSRAMADSARAPVRLLQANRTAHVIYDAQSATVGYAVYQTGTELAPGGPVDFVSAPCVLMVRVSTNRLDCSVAQPDPSRKTPVDVVLRGDWQTDATGVTRMVPSSGRSRFTVPCRDLLPLEFTVRRAASSAAAEP